MNNFFKKTLVASAVLAFAGAANAAVVQQTATLYSKQGVAAATNVAALPVYVILNAEYAVGDTLTITFPGATFASNTAPTLGVVDTNIAAELTAISGLSATDPDYKAANAPTIDPGLALVNLEDNITFGFLSSTSNSVTYRVTEKNQALLPTTIRGVVKLDGVVFAASSIEASAAVDVAFTAATSTGVAIDAATSSSGKFIAVRDQYALALTGAADGIIDVADDRLTFTGGSTNDVIQLSTTDASTLRLNRTVPTGGVRYTLSGDFSWVDANADGTPSTTELTNAIAITNGTTVAITPALDAITFRADVGATTSLTLQLPTGTNGKALRAIRPTSFSATANILDSVASAAASSYSVAAGSWILNGSQVRVPYMVVGGNRFGIITNIANHGAKDGNITLDIFAEDGSVIASNYAAGVSVAGSVTSIAGALNAALAANGVSTSSPVKFSYQITVNVPENDIIVYAAYTDNTTSERAIVNNDSKVQVKGANVDQKPQ